jgi:hypothetical protein
MRPEDWVVLFVVILVAIPVGLGFFLWRVLYPKVYGPAIRTKAGPAFCVFEDPLGYSKHIRAVTPQKPQSLGGISNVVLLCGRYVQCGWDTHLPLPRAGASWWTDPESQLDRPCQHCRGIYLRLQAGNHDRV